MYIFALACWTIFMVLAVYISKRLRHEDSPALAAYLIFVTVFTVTSFIIFITLASFIQYLGLAHEMTRPVFGTLFLFGVFGPAFLLAALIIRKPPRQRKLPR
jgi:hypothetical protein